MADFLTRLAERTLRTIPVAQPIIASMFAPQQFMTASIQETESWSTAGTAPVQDPASAFRAEAGSVTATQGEPDDPVPLHQEQEVLIEANRMVGDRVGPNQPGTSPTSRSPMRQGVQETSSPRSGLPVSQTGFPIVAEQPEEQDSVGARLIAPSVPSPQSIVPSPQPLVTNKLPAPTEQLLEGADTSEMAAKELIRAPQVRAPRLAPVSEITSRQGEPVALEQEEAISPQPLAERNSIVPLAPAERVSMSLNPETSFNPLLEETFDSIVASHSQTTSAINTTASYIHPGKEVTDRKQFNSGSARNQDNRKESPLLPNAATPETSMVGAPLAGALPGRTDALPGRTGTLPGLAPVLQDPETYMVGAPLAGALPGRTGALLDPTLAPQAPETSMVGAPLAGALSGLAPTLHIHNAAAPETSMVGAPLAGALPGGALPGMLPGRRTGALPGGALSGMLPGRPTGALPGVLPGRPTGALPEGEPAPALHDQGHIVPPMGDQKGNKPALHPSQPSSPLRTIGQIDVLPLEQHLLVSQAQVPQENIPQQQTDAPLINIFTPGLSRNQSQSRSSPAQHDQANIRPAPAPQAPETSMVGAPLAGALVESSPSIHITIGRIDVRAVTSPVPTPPSKPARPGPLLSLDDYLKQSKGGGQ